MAGCSLLHTPCTHTRVRTHTHTPWLMPPKRPLTAVSSTTLHWGHTCLLGPVRSRGAVGLRGLCHCVLGKKATQGLALDLEPGIPIGHRSDLKRGSSLGPQVPSVFMNLKKSS